jgi:hypothetical protein
LKPTHIRCPAANPHQEGQYTTDYTLSLFRDLRDVISSTTFFDLFRGLTVRVETIWILTNFGVVMDVVKSCDDHVTQVHPDTSGQDQILLSSAS